MSDFKYIDEKTVLQIMKLRAEIDQIISANLAEGLLLPGGLVDIFGPVASYAQGGNYNQDGGPYTQSGGGEHRQSGTGGYTQSKVMA